jgi:purine-binding chemotaxis protein CheW
MDGAPAHDAGPACLLRALIVTVDGERFAIPLEDVIEVLPAVAARSLPGAPEVVRGLLNVRGTPVPVLDLRTRLGRPARRPDPADHVVLCHIDERTVGVWVDHVAALTEIDTADLVPVTEVATADHVRGVALLPDGMLLVTDVRSFLDADEGLALDRAMAAASNGAGS